MRQRCVWLSLSVALLGGCASVAVDRAKDVSSAGIAYSRATAEVVEVAIDASIDASSERQVQVMNGRRLAQPVSAQDQARFADELQKADALAIENTVLYARLKRSVRAVEDYFVALQQLADGSPAEATGAAVEQLAQRVNGINEALGKTSSGQPRISDERKGAIVGLSKLVAKQVHGAALAKALERDAETIQRALVLQELVLNQAVGDIQAKLDDDMARFHTSRVVAPYKNGTIGGAWVDDHRTYVRAAALGQQQEQVASAQASARHMQEVWKRILSGEYSAQELTATLGDTEELLAAFAALKKANAK